MKKRTTAPATNLFPATATQVETLSTTPATTVTDILPVVAVEPIQPKSKAVQKLNELEQQKKKIIEDVKLELAKKLAAACDVIKELQDIGIKNVLGDNQYEEFCGILGISPQAELPLDTPIIKTPGRKGGSAGISVKEAVMKVLADGKEYNVAALMTDAAKHYGGEIGKPSANASLSVLKKEKQIKSAGRGLYVKM